MNDKQDLIVLVSAIIFFLCVIGCILTGMVMLWTCDWNIFAKLFLTFINIGTLAVLFADFIIY